MIDDLSRVAGVANKKPRVGAEGAPVLIPELDRRAGGVAPELDVDEDLERDLEFERDAERDLDAALEEDERLRYEADEWPFDDYPPDPL